MLPPARVADPALAKAAASLHQLRHLLLEAQLPPDVAPARQQLLLRAAGVLLDGSTPPAAAPLLTEMLQEGLRRQEIDLSEQDKVSCLGGCRMGGGGGAHAREVQWCYDHCRWGQNCRVLGTQA